MISKVIKIANSVGLIIPKVLMNSLGWKIGTQVEFEVVDKGSLLIFKKGNRNKKSLIEFYKFMNDFEERYGSVMKELANK